MSEAKPKLPPTVEHAFEPTQKMIDAAMKVMEASGRMDGGLEHRDRFLARDILIAALKAGKGV